VAIDAMEKARSRQTRPRKGRRTSSNKLAPFLLLGHPYTLHDRFLSDPILRKLRDLGADVEIISFTGKDEQPDLVRWGTSNKMYRRIQTLEPGERKGVIQITTFNCGCDSMMIELFRVTLREKKIPYLVLALDEHTAPAGLETRLEAFVDSLGW
jgi:predicted nucleotide-binding protein (sugar kinase/HSP70/actin superfamily)